MRWHLSGILSIFAKLERQKKLKKRTQNAWRPIGQAEHYRGSSGVTIGRCQLIFHYLLDSWRKSRMGVDRKSSANERIILKRLPLEGWGVKYDLLLWYWNKRSIRKMDIYFKYCQNISILFYSKWKLKT